MPSCPSPAPTSRPNRQQSSPNPLATVPGLFLGCVFCCLLWGSAFPCIKIGYELFDIALDDTATQLVFAGMRFILAGALVILGVSVAQRRALVPHKRDLAPIAALSAFQTVGQYIFFYLGLSKAAGITSSIIEASATFLAILFAALLFRSERLTARNVIGCIVGFSGVILVNVGGSGSGGISFALDGEGFIFISTIAGALSTCLISRFSSAHNPVLLSGWQFALGGCVLLALGLAQGGRLAIDQISAPLAGGALLLYMAFISAAAYSLWSRLLAVNPVSRVSIFGFMNPVFGALLSAALLGEGALVNPVFAIVALVLVSAGIIVVNRPARAGAEPAA